MDHPVHAPIPAGHARPGQDPGDPFARFPDDRSRRPAGHGSGLVTTPAFGRFFLPGPTDVHPDVLAAMQRPMIGHRSATMERLLAGLAAPLGRACVPDDAPGARRHRVGHRIHGACRPQRRAPPRAIHRERRVQRPLCQARGSVRQREHPPRRPPWARRGARHAAGRLAADPGRRGDGRALGNVDRRAAGRRRPRLRRARVRRRVVPGRCGHVARRFARGTRSVGPRLHVHRSPKRRSRCPPA